MATTTPDTIFTHVKNQLNLPSGDTSYTSTELLFHVNQALTEIGSTGFVSYASTTLALSSAGRVYSINGCTRIETVILQGRTDRLLPVDPETIIDDGGVNTTGTPRYYYQAGESIVVWPKPDTNYSLDVTYFGKPTTVTAIDDAITLPQTYLDAIPFYVAGWFLKREEKPQADEYLAMWQAKLQNAKIVDMRNHARKFAGPIRNGMTVNGPPHFVMEENG